MALSYRFEGDQLHVIAPEGFLLDDFEKLVHRALGDPACPDPASLLVDARQTTVNPPAANLQEAARLLGSLGSRIRPRIALVVERDLHFGLSQMLAAFAERHGLNVGVFRDLDEARAWLAADPSTGGS